MTSWTSDAVPFVANLTGDALTGSLRLMAGVGISVVLVQLMARWSSHDMSLRLFCKECLTLAVSDCLQETAEEVWQFEVVKSGVARQEAHPLFVARGRCAQGH